MGDSDRSETISSRFKDRGMRVLIHYLLDKCGSCPHRFICLDKILSSGGVREPMKEIYAHMRICDMKDTEPGTIGKAVAQFGTVCKVCPKQSVCAGYASAHIGRNAAEVQQAVKLCLNCPHLPNCAEGILNDLGLNKRKLLTAALKRFTWCKVKKKHPMMR